MEKTGEATYRTLLEFAAEGIIIVDRQGRITHANIKARELFGYEAEELIGKEVEVLVPDRVREVHVGRRNGFFANPRNRAIGVGQNLTARRKDGSEFPVEIALSHVGAGDSLLVMASVSDISIRRAMEKQLQDTMAERIRELEATLQTLESMASPPKAEVTARMMGVVPLREAAPAVYQEMAERYGRIMDRALEQRIVRTEEHISEILEDLAGSLGFLKATPRDVVELHSSVLKGKSRDAPFQRVQGYLREGHFLLVELLGHVASYYRNQAISPGSARREQQTEGGNNGR